MEKTFNIKDFVNILNTLDYNSPTKNYFKDIIDLYNQSLGGCGCNRKAREDKAEIIFIEKVTNSNLEYIEDIKRNTNSELINFIRRDNFIFRTF